MTDTATPPVTPVNIWHVQENQWGTASSGAYDLIVLARVPKTTDEWVWVAECVVVRLRPRGRLVMVSP